MGIELKKQYYIWEFYADNYPLKTRYVYATYDRLLLSDSVYYLFRN